MVDDPSPGRSRTLCRLATASCSWLVCSPPALPADTRAKRLADRILPRSGWPAGVYFGGVGGLLVVAPALSTRPGLAAIGLASLGGGAWCAVNFWRCRHAHCVVTGTGWLVLGALGLAGAGLGHSVVGGAERPVFLAVLALGVAFEAATYLNRGSYALTSTSPGHDDSVAVRPGSG